MLPFGLVHYPNLCAGSVSLLLKGMYAIAKRWMSVRCATVPPSEVLANSPLHTN